MRRVTSAKGRSALTLVPIHDDTVGFTGFFGPESPDSRSPPPASWGVPVSVLICGASDGGAPASWEPELALPDEPHAAARSTSAGNAAEASVGLMPHDEQRSVRLQPLRRALPPSRSSPDPSPAPPPASA